MTQKHKILSIGIDVAKAHLDVYCMNDQSAMRFNNDGGGIARLIKWALARGKQPLIVLEPSGGYERDLEREIQSRNDILLAKVNAKYIRDFARAKGRLAKTDAIDAQVIAEYGMLMSPRTSIPITADQNALKDLVIRRRQVTKMHAEENNRLEKAKSSMAVDSIQAMILILKQEIKIILFCNIRYNDLLHIRLSKIGRYFFCFVSLEICVNSFYFITFLDKVKCR